VPHHLDVSFGITVHDIANQDLRLGIVESKSAGYCITKRTHSF
jgi:hypothetical protein